MKNRIPNDRFIFPHQLPRTPTAPTDLLHVTQKQLDQRRRWIETYVQEHPAVGMGAALCLGVLIGWFIKRK